MNIFKEIWEGLDGKKRIIALVYWSIIIPTIIIIWPEGAPMIVEKMSAIIGVTFSALGLGHAGIKYYKHEN